MPQANAILRAFCCPNDCHLYDPAYIQLINCPFGHNSNVDDQNLKPVAALACVADLMEDCKQTVLKKVGDGQQYWRCSDGVHFEKAETVNELEHHFIEVMHNFEAYEDDVPFLESAPNHDCSICMRPITGLFGQLSDCEHIFCATCPINWFKQAENNPLGASKTCPVCRTPSIFVLPTQVVISTKEKKIDLFNKQKEALSVSSNVRFLTIPRF